MVTVLRMASFKSWVSTNAPMNANGPLKRIVMSTHPVVNGSLMRSKNFSIRVRRSGPFFSVPDVTLVRAAQFLLNDERMAAHIEIPSLPRTLQWSQA